MDNTISALRQLFEWLLEEQRRSWFPHNGNSRRSRPSARAMEVWHLLINSCPPIEEKDIDYWFPTTAKDLDVDFSRKRRFLYLPPLEKDAEFVPVLSLKCFLNADRRVTRLRVMLVCLSEDDGEPGKKELRAVKFRLEGPHGDEQENERNEEEGDKPEGRHDFYHAQLVQDSVGGSRIESPNWLPESQPSFPLVANCPVTLVLCLLLTLYGKRQSLKLIKRNTDLWKWLTSYMITLQTWIKWKELEDAFA